MAKLNKGVSIEIEALKIGDIFKRKIGAKKTFERGAYCQENKAYECTNLDDISDFIYFKKGSLIFEI